MSGEDVEGRKIIYVVYFLGRDGATDQPHMMRVRHRHRDGAVRLIDVKRWLSKLRGKEIAEAYAWSYKRKYKAGYVWQDIADEDFITPVGDNEYVLKGSYMTHISPQTGTLHKHAKEHHKDHSQTPSEAMLSATRDASTQTSPPPPHRATAVFKLDVNAQHKLLTNSELEATLELTKKHTKERPTRSLDKTNITTHVLRNFITCGGTETRDSVDRRSRCKEEKSEFEYRRLRQSPPRPETCRRSCGGRTRPRSGPSTEPRCSQCGKEFKPERLHSHMKSCKVLKGRGVKNSRFDGSRQSRHYPV